MCTIVAEMEIIYYINGRETSSAIANLSSTSTYTAPERSSLPEVVLPPSLAQTGWISSLINITLSKFFKIRCFLLISKFYGFTCFFGYPFNSFVSGRIEWNFR